MKIITDRFIKPLLGKTFGNVGTELEFPIINLNRADIDVTLANGLYGHFLSNGFKILEKTGQGTPAFIGNADGDCISFDNSYNNIEFAMYYGDNLLDISERFYRLFAAAHEFLRPYNYVITGLGTNPYKKYISQNRVHYSVYSRVDEYLKNCVGDLHEYRDFPAYLSSVQTHLDLPVELLPEAFNLFARLDFLRAFLFSNSLPFEGRDRLCYRDYLWEKSGFPNVGKVDGELHSIDGLIESYMKRRMYDKDNVQHFYSFRNVEITDKGTLEIRSDCAQPIADAFLPPAFSLGVLYSMDKVKDILYTFLNENNCKSSNSKLRDDVIQMKSEFSNEKLVRLATAISEAALEGIKKRGKGEEALLANLTKRASSGICPALDTINRLNSGESIENIILRNSILPHGV